MHILGGFILQFLPRETTFVTSCLVYCTSAPSKMGSSLKGKNLLQSGANSFLYPFFRREHGANSFLLGPFLDGCHSCLTVACQESVFVLLNSSLLFII